MKVISDGQKVLSQQAERYSTEAEDRTYKLSAATQQFLTESAKQLWNYDKHFKDIRRQEMSDLNQLSDKVSGAADKSRENTNNVGQIMFELTMANMDRADR